jgi:hypothetical protein
MYELEFLSYGYWHLIKWGSVVDCARCLRRELEAPDTGPQKYRIVRPDGTLCPFVPR